MKHAICDTCGRDMGDIEALTCHECEQAGIDKLAAQGLDRYGRPLDTLPVIDFELCM